MPSVSFEAPSEYQTEAEEIARRRKYAEALQAQSIQPMETQMAGGWAIPTSPVQGIAKLAQALAGRKGLERATAEQRALAEKYNTERGAALAAALRAGQGAPATSEMIVDEQANGGEGAPAQINAPAVAPNRQAMIAALSGSKFPDLQTAGMQQAFADLKPMVVGKSIMTPTGQLIGSDPTWAAEHEADRNARAEAAQLQREQRQRELEMRLEDQRLAREDRAALARELADLKAQSARELKALVSASTPITAVTLQDPNDPNKTIIVDGRTNRVIGPGPMATDAGKLEQKRQFNMQGIGATIQEARDLLTGTKGGVAGAGDKPTSSGIGAAVDVAGSIVGMSPKGAVPAAQLKAVGGSLVSKMPRMEGPQSDKDVVLYKEMAGKVGDATVPIDQRTAALDVIEKLWSKYERLNPTAFADRRAGGDEPPPGAVRPRAR